MDELLKEFKAGKISIDVVKDKLIGFNDLSHSKIDVNREERTGFPEIIYGESKSAQEIIDILHTLNKQTKSLLVTRIDENKAQEVLKEFSDLNYSQSSQLLFSEYQSLSSSDSYIAVLTAGTSDSNVAEEAAITAEVFGNKVKRFYDVGVAGIHRLFNEMDQIKEADVIIVVAGMEGALASVVGGLVSKPIIAVPTSVGYGSNFSGLSALLTMLNSCSSGISVVNIDNGFGAAYNACQIVNLVTSHSD